MELKARLLYEVFCQPVRAILGGRIQDPCIDQFRQYVVKVILEPVPCGDIGTDLRKSEGSIDVLQEKITDIEEFLFPFFQQF